MVFLFQTTRRKYTSAADSVESVATTKAILDIPNSKVHNNAEKIHAVKVLFQPVKNQDGFTVLAQKQPSSKLKSTPVKTGVQVIGTNLTFQQTIAMASKNGYKILSNSEIDAFLLSGKITKKQEDALPIWTGTFVAYVAPGEKLGQTIQFDGLTLTVPSEFHGKLGMIVCKHSDLQLDGAIITIKPGKAELVPIPAKDGWYVQDEHGIPNGKAGVFTDGGNVRRLTRQNKPYVGLLVRGDDWLGVNIMNRLYVHAYNQPSARFGVLGEK